MHSLSSPLPTDSITISSFQKNGVRNPIPRRSSPLSTVDSVSRRHPIHSGFEEPLPCEQIRDGANFEDAFTIVNLPSQQICAEKFLSKISSFPVENHVTICTHESKLKKPVVLSRECDLAACQVGLPLWQLMQKSMERKLALFFGNVIPTPL